MGFATQASARSTQATAAGMRTRRKIAVRPGALGSQVRVSVAGQIAAPRYARGGRCRGCAASTGGLRATRNSSHHSDIAKVPQLHGPADLAPAALACCFASSAALPLFRAAPPAAPLGRQHAASLHPPPHQPHARARGAPQALAALARIAHDAAAGGGNQCHDREARARALVRPRTRASAAASLCGRVPLPPAFGRPTCAAAAAAAAPAGWAPSTPLLRCPLESSLRCLR